MLRRGLVDGVAHVGAVADPQADGRFFRYRISRGVDDLAAGAKSRYYPVEMSEVLHAIRATPGRYAVVGIPCFIKAIQLLRREDPVLRERIAFTLGLFCGHMKSARFLDSFARQLGVDPQEVVSADFRRKDASRPANWYTVQFGLRDGRSVWQDWFHLAEGDWGSGFFQNGACDFCDDVVAETADISFGDAWVEPYSQDGRGTNVVLVRSAVLQRIVAEGIADRRLQLEDVDADFVRRTQAAGLRQRREGLAYRLTWPRAGLQPRKRVRPEAGAVVTRRRLVYRARAHISRFSRVLYRLAERCGQRRAYFAWARGVLAVYQGLVYSRGRIGALLDRVWPKPMP
jgi:coenzyme F420-reducing hydrogenase beta subunit